MLKSILFIGTGSFIGGVGRYLLSKWLQSMTQDIFPWGTFAVNLLGCLFIGIIYGAIDRGYELSPETRLFLTVGICGGFTTFSTFIHENYLLFGESNVPTAILYAGASFTIGLLSAHTGHWIIKSI